MSETVMRYIKMLELVPRHAGGISVADLHAKLLSLEFRVDRRSVERDLNNLSGMFPITSSGSRPSRWHWMPQTPQMTLPGLDPVTALTYELVARYLQPLLPRRLLTTLEPQFSAARHALNGLKVSDVGRWSGKIAVIPQTQPLLSPDVAAGVTEVVHESLLSNRRFEVSYRAAESERAKRYPMNPLGLVLHGGVLYLVGTARDYPEPCIFALHRMSNARLLDEPATVPDGFDLDHYVREEHAFEHPHGGDIRLELVVTSWLAQQLEERRLAADQTISPMGDSGQMRLRATVADTGQLHWWLLSLGTEVEVIKPAKLRRKMAAEFAVLTERYGG